MTQVAEVEPPTLEDAGLTQEEVDTCLKVLERMAGNTSLYQSKPMKGLRKAIVPFADRLPNLSQLDTKARAKNVKLEKQRKKQEQLREDRRQAERTALRQGRMEKLKALQEQGEDTKLMIPDGVAQEFLHVEGADQRMIGDVPTPQQESVSDENVVIIETVGEEKAIVGEASGSEPDAKRLRKSKACYTCKNRYDTLHHFYDALCPTCAALNWEKRFHKPDLTGRRALLTGARVKIGFQIGLRLLRAGCEVIATSRFPNDTAVRYASQEDFATFKDRLHVVGMDLRFPNKVEAFVDYLCDNFSHFDFVVHNACQTIRRPASYYAHLMDGERKEFEALSDGTQHVLKKFSTKASAKPMIVDSNNQATAVVQNTAQRDVANSTSAELSQLAIMKEDTCFDSLPEGITDVNGQQLDLRKKNSWLLKLNEVETPELAEVFLVNAMAPFIMNGRLKDLVLKSPFKDRYIVNVSAMEGKFYRRKQPTHPHTNMAKAALNMMTRTSGEDYAKSGIYMTSVDTGWINDENPLEKAKAHQETQNFMTPIDEIDAAARVVDPIFSGVEMVRDGKVPPHGVFFKDYFETEW